MSGYEVFQLTYNLLVDFDKDAKPAPGFAESWERQPDKVVFKIREGMKWSDGTPATSKDVCYSWGLAVAAIAAEANVGAGYLDPGVKDAGVTKVECPDDNTFIAYTTDQSDRIFQVYVPILPAHIYRTRTTRRSPRTRSTRRSSARGRTSSRSGRPASSPGSPATPSTGARRATRTRW